MLNNIIGIGWNKGGGEVLFVQKVSVSVSLMSVLVCYNNCETSLTNSSSPVRMFLASGSVTARGWGSDGYIALCSKWELCGFGLGTKLTLVFIMHGRGVTAGTETRRFNAVLEVATHMPKL